MSHKLHTIILIAVSIAVGNVPQPNYEVVMAQSRIRMLIKLLDRAPEQRKKAIRNEIQHNRAIIQSYNGGK